ncbi:MAG: hypothetical protein WC306_03760, partial [Candidatus Paceibacterota bacterium]
GTAQVQYLVGGDQTIAGSTGWMSGVLASKSSGNLSMSGNLNIGYGGFYQEEGTFVCGANTLKISGNFTKTGGTFDEGTSTVIFAQDGGTRTFNVDTSETFYNVEIAPSSAYTLQIASGDTMVVTNNLTFSNGVLDGPGTIEMQGTTMTVVSGWDGGTCNIKFTETAVQSLTANDTDFLNGTVTVNKSSGTLTTGGSAVWTLGGALTIQEGTLSLGNSATFNGGVTVESGGTLTCTTGGNTITIDDADTVTVNSGGNLTFQGTSGNLVIFKSDSTSAAFDLTMNGSYIMDYINVSWSDASSGSPIIASNSTGSNTTNWIIVAGTVKFWDGGGSTNDWSEAANWVGDAVPGTTELAALNGGSGPDPDKDCTFNNAGTWSGGSFYITNGYTGTITLSVDMNVATYYQADGTLTAGARTITVTGNYTKVGGIFNEDTSTVIFGGTTNGTFDVATTETFNNVTINKTDATNNILTITDGDTMIVAGTLNLTDGVVNTGTIEAQGAINVAATFNQGNANVTCSGTSAQLITMTGDLFPTGTFTINKASNTATTSGTLTLAGALVIQEGTLSLGSDTNFNGGVTVEAGGTLSSTTAGITITIEHGDTLTVNADGTLTIQGAALNLITLTSDNTTQWNIIMLGNIYNLDYVNVSYSNASGGHTMYAANSTDGGNNTNWVFNTGSIITWDGSASSDWFTAANWDLNRTPVEADDVVIDLTSTIDLPFQTQIHSLTIGNALGTTSPTLNFTYDAITSGALAIIGGNLTVNTGAIITHSAGTTAVVGTIYIDVQGGDATIAGSINVNYKGYQYSEGPGAGEDAVYYGAGGGSYGGEGGDGTMNLAGSVYGSLTQPNQLGSGGGNGAGPGYYGGFGGGAVKLIVSGTTTISGSITANGQNYQTVWAGGGSGGSVWISTGTLAGAGTISANGGNGDADGGGAGGGGRIAAYYTTDSSTIAYQAYGGIEGNSTKERMGGAGTIYKKAAAAANGDLTIDNNDQDSWYDSYIGRTPLNATYAFDTINIQNYGNLETGTSSNITYTTLNWSDQGIITDNGGIFAIVSDGGNLIIPANSKLEGNFARTFTGLTVNGTLTHVGNLLSETYKLNYTINGDVLIAAGGVINVNCKGYQHSEGPGAGGDAVNYGAGGAGYGGEGGDGFYNAGGSVYGSITEPNNIGSGGGDGTFGSSSYLAGAGAGAIKLTISGTLTVTGNITANGQDYVSLWAGGGSGGSIWISAATLAGAGTISANGGVGDTNNGAGGGGGRVAVYYTTDSSSITYQACGGTRYNGNTDRMGGAGTIYKKAAAQANGDLIIDNNDLDNWNDGSIGKTVLNSSFTFDTIYVQNYGYLDVGASANITYSALNWSNQGIIADNGGTFVLVSGGGTLTIPANARLAGNTTRTFTGLTVNGTLTHSNNTTAETYKLNYTINGDVLIASGGAINVNYKGYQHSEGPGTGEDSVSHGAGGAGYGGEGGDGLYNAGGPSYGSITEPNNIGSGGGDGAGSSYLGGMGAGAVKLTISGILTVTGNITANGETCVNLWGGGGSGGSVWINTGTLAGAGIISANGGNGEINNGGGGGGGRIAIYYTTDSSTVTYQVFGGTMGGDTSRMGGAGTVYLKASSQTYGDLLIDGNDQDNWDDRYAMRTFLNDTYIFDTITIQNYGNLEIGPSANIAYNNLNWSNKGIITDNGGIFALVSGGGSLTIPATSRLVANTSRTFTGLTVNGTLTHSTNSTAETYKLNYTINGDVNVASGGAINVNYRGYQHSAGPGAGADGNCAGGAGYGGEGGDGTGAAGGSAYGSITEPSNIGSGGGDIDGSGSNGYWGGSGGGAIKLTISGTLTISGDITANGANYVSYYAGGGSGGSIWINAGALAGAGNVTANGGNGHEWGAGGGGGGRIAMYYTTDSSTVAYQAYGGTEASATADNMGGSGTIYKKAAAASNGDLIIDNNDQDSLNDLYAGTTPINETIAFNAITIRNYGNLETRASANITYSSLDWSTKGCITDNGGIFSLLSGGGTLTVPATSRLYAYTE